MTNVAAKLLLPHMHITHQTIASGGSNILRIVKPPANIYIVKTKEVKYISRYSCMLTCIPVVANTRTRRIAGLTTGARAQNHAIVSRPAMPVVVLKFPEVAAQLGSHLLAE